jgi:hypothetical protein
MGPCEFGRMAIVKVVKTWPRWLRLIEEAAWDLGALLKNTRYLRADFIIGFIRRLGTQAQDG